MLQCKTLARRWPFHSNQIRRYSSINKFVDELVDKTIIRQLRYNNINVKTTKTNEKLTSEPKTCHHEIKSKFQSQIYSPKSVQKNKQYDKELKEIMSSKGTAAALESLQKSAINDSVYPTEKTLQVLAAKLAMEGKYEAITKVGDICSVAFPGEHLRQIGYRHYVADAKWKCGEYEESLRQFGDLFIQCPHMRIKLKNLSNFLIAQIVNCNEECMFPAVVSFVNICRDAGDLNPTANLWRHAFVSDRFKVQLLASELIVEECKEQILTACENKFDFIIKIANQNQNGNVLQRLMEFVLVHRMKSCYQKVFSAYMEFNCKNGHIDQAMETFKFISKENIILPHEIIEKYFLLLGENNKQIPFQLFQMKNTNNNNNDSNNVKFKF